MPIYVTLVSHDKESVGRKNTDWSEWCGKVLFGCKHQHRETERRGNEHFDEHALGEIDIRRRNRARRR